MKKSCAILLVLLAAPAPAARAQVGDSPYYPLQVGNSWTYRVGNGSFTMKVTKHEKVDNSLTARVDLIRDGKTEDFENIIVKPDGLYRLNVGNVKAEPAVRFLKLPPKKGETWMIEGKAGGMALKGTFKIGEEEIKVPAGTFKTITATCDDLDVGGMKFSVTYYFAEGTGIVKQVVESAGQKLIYDLEKFEPGKK
jgi:hypothetical protein